MVNKITWIIFAFIVVIVGFLLYTAVFKGVLPTAKSLGGIGCDFYCDLKHGGFWSELLSSPFGRCSC